MVLEFYIKILIEIVAQSYLTLCNPWTIACQAPLFMAFFLAKILRVGNHSLLQGIFLIWVKILVNFELSLISIKLIRNCNIYFPRAVQNTTVDIEDEHFRVLRRYVLLFLGWLPALGKRWAGWEAQAFSTPGELACASRETGTWRKVIQRTLEMETFLPLLFLKDLV